MQLEIPNLTQEAEDTTATATTDGKVTQASVAANATEEALRNKGKQPEPEKPKDEPKATEEQPQKPADESPTLEIKVPEKVDFDVVAKEFADNNGELSEKTVKLLEAKGITKAIIETFIEGQKARALVTRSELAKAVGGDESLNAVLEWAATGLQPEEISTYNQLLKSSDLSAQKVALQALKAKMDADVGTEGTRVVAEGTPGTRGVKGYDSWAEVQKDMRSPEYKNDPAFRNKVAQRLAKSELN